MAHAPLATTADLTTLGVDVSDAALAALALDAASAAVRDAAGSVISQVTATYDLQGNRSQWLDLSASPTVDVASVAIDDVPVTDYRLISGSLFRADGWGACLPTVVTVTATHGYAEVPADIKLLVCELAAAGMNAARDGIEVKTRMQSEGIDDYNVSFITGAEAMASVMDLPERNRARLRNRFGGGVYVTGVR